MNLKGVRQVGKPRLPWSNQGSRNTRLSQRWRILSRLFCFASTPRTLRRGPTHPVTVQCRGLAAGYALGPYRAPLRQQEGADALTISTRLQSPNTYGHKFIYRHLELTTRDVLAKVERFEPPERTKEGLTTAQLEQVLGCNDDSDDYTHIRDRAMLAVYAASGLRFVEVLNLEVEQLDRSGGQSIFRRLEKACGLPWMHSHRFRQTRAPTALRKGAERAIVQDAMGWSSDRMARRYQGWVRHQTAAAGAREVHNFSRPAISCRPKLERGRDSNPRPQLWEVCLRGWGYFLLFVLFRLVNFPGTPSRAVACAGAIVREMTESKPPQRIALVDRSRCDWPRLSRARPDRSQVS
jgi:hypothetical protein